MGYRYSERNALTGSGECKDGWGDLTSRMLVILDNLERLMYSLMYQSVSIWFNAIELASLQSYDSAVDATISVSSVKVVCTFHTASSRHCAALALTSSQFSYHPALTPSSSCNR